MVPEVFADLVAIIERHDAGERLSASEVRAAIGEPSDTGEATMYRVGNTAVIPVRGVIARYADQVNGVCQRNGRSAESIQADIKTAMADLMVSRIALRIDSPGGSVAGTAETGAAIKAASAAGKPVHAFIDGMAASAAYWLASQADSITASAPTAEAGSIGVITAHVDETKRNEDRGVRVHVIRSTALKAPGTAGESLSAEQMSSIQREITQLHNVFADTVAAGRNLSPAQIAQVATGEIWTAAQAQSLGLIDGVQGWDAWIAGLSNSPSRSQRTGAKASTPSTKAKTMALTIEQLAAITAKHPTKAADIVAFAKDGKSLEQIEAKIGDDARAEELTSLKVKATDAELALTAEKTAHAATKTEHEAAIKTKDAEIGRLAKLAGIKPKHEDPGPGEGGTPHRSQMSHAEKGKYMTAHGVEAYQALPL